MLSHRSLFLEISWLSAKKYGYYTCRLSLEVKILNHSPKVVLVLRRLG
jgi:hypothetical protein